MSAQRTFLAAVLALCVLTGCQPPQRSSPEAERLHVIQGLGFPESVRYDPDQDVYFISNMAGAGSVKDGNGYIVRVPAGELEPVEIFVQGGRNGAQLDAPKGMALQGDTLWVADIDVLRAFDRRTGAPLGMIDLRPQRAVLLNDVAAAPDGTLRATDTGIAMTPKGVIYGEGDRIFEVRPGPTPAITQHRPVRRPNGITWDASGKRWLVVSFDPFVSELYALSGNERTVLARGHGRFDGVERLDDGRILFTAWSDSAVHILTGSRDRKLIRDVWQPADLGVDTRRGRVAVPLVLQGRVEIWSIPPR